MNRTFSKSPIRDFRSIIPIHMQIVALTSLFSLILAFLPSHMLVVKYAPSGRFSVFSLFLSLFQEIPIEGHSFALRGMGALPFLIIILFFPVLQLAVSITYPLLQKCFSKKAPAIISLVMMLLQLSSYALMPGALLAGSLSGADPTFATTVQLGLLLFANITLILYFIGTCAALFGALGLQIRFKMLAYPYFMWLLVFTILPLLLIFFRAFFVKAGVGYSFTLRGFETLFVNRFVEARFYGVTLHLQEYFSVFLRSLDYALWTTIGCLLIAYPLAYILSTRAKRNHSTSGLLLMFFVLPMWINTMLRTYAWRAFFSPTGVLNQLLMSLSLVGEPIMFMKIDFLADFIVKLVLVNDFLPFMLLPVYSVLVKLDDNIYQAARDLGANRRQAFVRVTLPLSLPGIISGIQMVFMPAMTFYMIPDIISEGSITTIGNTVQSFILNESTAQQQAGNVLSLILLIFVLVTMGLLRNQDKESGGGGGMLL